MSLYHGLDGFVPCQREALFPGYIDKPCDYGSTVFHNPPCSRRTGMIMGVLFSIILPVRKPCDYGSTVFQNTPCLQTVCYPSPRAIFGGLPGILEAFWHGVSWMLTIQKFCHNISPAPVSDKEGNTVITWRRHPHSDSYLLIIFESLSFRYEKNPPWRWNGILESDP